MPDIIVTDDLVELTRVGLRKVYLNEYEAPGTIWNRIFPELDSDLATEQELIMAGFPAVPQWNADGGGISYAKPVSGGRILFTHTDYALGWVLSHKMIRDDLYEKTGKDLSTAAALSTRHSVEQDCANVFNNAFTTLGPDGKVLCATDHPLLGGGSQANRPVAGGALTKTTLSNAVTAFMRMTNHMGQPIVMSAIYLVVPPELWETAKQLVSGSWDATDNKHAENMLKGVVSDVIVWPYLVSTTAWFLVAATNQTKLRFFWRERPSYDADKDFHTKGIANSVNYAYSVGYTAYDGVYGNPGV